MGARELHAFHDIDCVCVTGRNVAESKCKVVSFW